MFTPIRVDLDQNGYRYVAWGMSEAPATLAAFRVLYSYSPNSDWVVLADVTNACLYIDTVKRVWNKENELYYKVQALNAGKTVLEESCVGLAGEMLSGDDKGALMTLFQAAATEIRVSGRPGYLLKKMEWGTPCPVCLDYGTGRSMDPKCPTCMGTGIQGGYYQAISLPLLQAAKQGKAERLPTHYGETKVFTATCLALPVINREDIWAGTGQNDRYFIENVSPSSDLRGRPVTYTLELHQIPQDDVVYTAAMNAKIPTFKGY